MGWVWEGMGRGGGLGRVKFILELLNFKEDSASGWGGFGKGVVSCVFLSLCLEQNNFPRRNQDCVHWELNNISDLYLFQSCRDS